MLIPKSSRSDSEAIRLSSDWIEKDASLNKPRHALEEMER